MKGAPHGTRAWARTHATLPKGHDHLAHPPAPGYREADRPPRSRCNSTDAGGGRQRTLTSRSTHPAGATGERLDPGSADRWNQAVADPEASPQVPGVRTAEYPFTLGRSRVPAGVDTDSNLGQRPALLGRPGTLNQHRSTLAAGPSALGPTDLRGPNRRQRVVLPRIHRRPAQRPQLVDRRLARGAGLDGEPDFDHPPPADHGGTQVRQARRTPSRPRKAPGR